MKVQITSIEIRDIRFPTSRSLDGSDAMNPDPDYSAAYLIINTSKPGLQGHGLTFTIGRGNEVCCAALEAYAPMLIGRDMREITSDFGMFYRYLTGDSQLRWLGPEKGVIHLAAAAVVNALWDLYAKMEGKPLWRLLVNMSPEQLVACLDLSYLSEVLTPEEAITLLKAGEAGKNERIRFLERNGYPAYTTSAGWLGYPDDKIRHLCREALSQGFRHIKMKVGLRLEDDMRRAAIIREEIGYDNHLMMDANQKWEVGQAIENMRHLAAFKPYWIEEPTSPDDILGHARIAEAIRPIKVATGEHCHNRVMFRQLMQAGGMEVCQIDSCRVGGVNENLAILLMAAKFGIPVCPHAGGVGLCEYVQHLAMFDFVAVSGSLEGRMIEYVDHLHEHFLDPVQIRNGRYMPPVKPGYSIEMKADTLRNYAYPEGRVWAEESAY
ncbi:MAG: L-fuconate dehydratase [Cyclobacteriaceae bacterium]